MEDGGTAFPAFIGDQRLGLGMSLRDYFAGQALAGLASDKVMPADVWALVELAYHVADSMLARREVN